MSSQNKPKFQNNSKNTTSKTPVVLSKAPLKAALRHAVKVFRLIDKGLDLGVRIFDYVVKVSKVAALFLGATTAVYVAKEIPNRSETDTMGDVVERAVDNMGRDVNHVVNRTCPRSARPRPNRNEKPKNTQQKSDMPKTETQKNIGQKANQTIPQKISTRQVPFIYLQDWQNIR